MTGMGLVWFGYCVAKIDSKTGPVRELERRPDAASNLGSMGVVDSSPLLRNRGVCAKSDSDRELEGRDHGLAIDESCPES